MADATTAAVLAMLDQVEVQERVRVCLAVESGSRAWGFPSADSDYDVRFVYVHHPDWYLSIDEGRDVLERPLTNMIDLSGWDIRKALKLFRKSNPPLLEWLQCPMIYREAPTLAATLREWSPRFFSPDASFHHYLHMARGNFREYLQGERVWRKKYLYVLRPLLAIRWIESGRGPAPIEFGRLVEAAALAPELSGAIDRLVAEKLAGAELDEGPRDPALSQFIESEMVRLETPEPAVRTPAAPTDDLNDLFRRIIDETWGRR